jgi:hypothetical protein
MVIVKKQAAFVVLLLSVISLFSCKTGKPDELENALEFAGKNRGELEKVLAYYSKPADSLQLKAAKFLILNMPYHYGYYGKEVNTYSNIFSIIDTVSYTKESLSNDDKSKIGDNVLEAYGRPDPERAEKIYDSRILTAAYLINNIEFAFKAWQKTPWAKQVSYNDFCDYILPYRTKEERVEYWRPPFYEQNKKWLQYGNGASRVFGDINWHLNSETSFTVFFDKYYPFNQSIGDIIRGRIGSCQNTSFLATSAMRAVGLPVGYDYIMHWGNSNSRHYMPHLVGRFDSLHLITNENVQENTWHLVDFSSEFNESRHKFTLDEMTEGLYIQNVRTIPKVYRYTYSQSSLLLDLNKNVPKEYLSPEFYQTNLKDVTDEYVTTSDVILPVADSLRRYQAAYLCVFDLQGWQPVAVTKINNGEAKFLQLGRQTMYLPTVYHNEKHWAVGSPFYVDSLNKVHPLTAGNRKTNLKLFRKYPLFTYTAYHAEIVKGGRFEGANDPLFTQATTLYEINKYPFYVTQVASQSNNNYRYVRYVAPRDANFEPDNIAEIQFIGANGKPLKGKAIGVEGKDGHGIEKAFDGNLDSYYLNAKNRDGWIGLDLGEGNKEVVKQIMFCPRNDTNGMMPGLEYELLYWDGQGWVSLGEQTASNYWLTINGAPENALFWLRCLSGGKEERIFTYDNGKQVWW